MVVKIFIRKIYNMQKSKRTAIRKSRKSHKKRRFTKRRIVKGGGDNQQSIQKDNEFVNTIITPYQQEQRQEAIRREIMLRRAEAEEERQRAEEIRQRAEEIRQSDLRRQIIARERQIEEERLREVERQGNQGSALDALFGLP